MYIVVDEYIADPTVEVARDRIDFEFCPLLTHLDHLECDGCAVYFLVLKIQKKKCSEKKEKYFFFSIEFFSEKSEIIFCRPPPSLTLNLSSHKMKFFDCYSAKMASLLRIRFFLTLLKTSCAPGSPEFKLVVKLQKDFGESRLRVKDIQDGFGRDVITKFFREAQDECVSQTLKLCTEKGDGKCIVCTEWAANYYVVHGMCAHKVVCAQCAMQLCFQPTPKCPISREPIRYLLKCTKTDLIPCVCNRPSCRRHVLVKSVKSASGARVLEEVGQCHTCTLDLAGNRHSCVQIFELFV